MYSGHALVMRRPSLTEVTCEHSLLPTQPILLMTLSRCCPHELCTIIFTVQRYLSESEVKVGDDLEVGGPVCQELGPLALEGGAVLDQHLGLQTGRCRRRRLWGCHRTILAMRLRGIALVVIQHQRPHLILGIHATLEPWEPPQPRSGDPQLQPACIGKPSASHHSPPCPRGATSGESMIARSSASINFTQIERRARVEHFCSCSS
jgi:hypothetical protein